MNEEKNKPLNTGKTQDGNAKPVENKVSFDTALLDDTSIFAATNEITRQSDQKDETIKKTEQSTPQKENRSELPADKKTKSDSLKTGTEKKQTQSAAKPVAKQQKGDVKSSGIVEKNDENDKPQTNWGKELRDWVAAIAIAVVLALLIRNFVFTLVKVQGQSMEPTLHNADRLYVNRFFYTPKKGDVIIFIPESDPKRPYVKRVIATAGDSVYIDFKTGDVYVNDLLVDEPYIKEKTRTPGSYIMSLVQQGEYGPDTPIVVQEGHIFVMGDNRNNSKDSRELGQIPLDEVLGGAVFRFWPLDNVGSVHRDAISTSLLNEDSEYGLG